MGQIILRCSNCGNTNFIKDETDTLLTQNGCYFGFFYDRVTCKTCGLKKQISKKEYNFEE